MDQSVHFITFATTDLDAARRFYADALGWRPLMDVPDEIIFFQIAPGVVLGFFRVDKFAHDIGDGSDHSRISGVALSHNVDSPEKVRSTVEAMTAAGGTQLKKPQTSEFGGILNAHVQDPNGIVWEIAHNPGWRIDQNGTVSIQ